VKKADYDRALRLYRGTAARPCAVEVKNRGEKKWRRYRIVDVSKIDWDAVDAARVHFADKAWRDGVADENYTTVVRVYPR
jgi:hypothetical protein